jgi:hypothetical protein
MENQTTTIPSTFRSVIVDFTKDLSSTYPEYASILAAWSGDFSEEALLSLYQYCLTVYPERFFDILYQNDDIFLETSTANTFFLPNIDFKQLYHCSGISETTKKTLWKYLQLLLFTIINDVKDKSTFGDTMNLFEGIEESELHNKLKETLSGITDFFKNIGEQASTSTNEDERQTEDQDQDKPQKPSMPEFKMPDMSNMPPGFDKFFENMPDMEKIQDHLKTLFEGKIGSLAKEMAEEIAGDFSDLLGEDPNNLENSAEAMKKLMKNPQKLMELMKKISSKLDEKMKNGDISKEELMKEASEMIGKMKGMGGPDNFKEMFEKMTKNMGGLGKNMRMDTNAIARMTKQEAMKEHLRKKLNAKREQMQQNQLRSAAAAANFSLEAKNGANDLVFRLGEEQAQEKSYIHPDILAEMEKEAVKSKPEAKKSNKKKKGKK